LLPAKNREESNPDPDKKLQDYRLAIQRSKSLYGPSNGLFQVRCPASKSTNTKKGSNIMTEMTCDKNYYVYNNSKCQTGKPRWNSVSCG
jgi:hypothetical protein